MIVFVVRAVNNADFDSNDLTSAGLTLEKANEQMEEMLKAEYSECIQDPDYADFYEDYDMFRRGWRTEWCQCEVAQ